jgi:hypothetical protein
VTDESEEGAFHVRVAPPLVGATMSPVGEEGRVLVGTTSADQADGVPSIPSTIGITRKIYAAPLTSPSSVTAGATFCHLLPFETPPSHELSTK